MKVFVPEHVSRIHASTASTNEQHYHTCNTTVYLRAHVHTHTHVYIYIHISIHPFFFLSVSLSLSVSLPRSLSLYVDLGPFLLTLFAQTSFSDRSMPVHATTSSSFVISKASVGWMIPWGKQLGSNIQSSKSWKILSAPWWMESLTN